MANTKPSKKKPSSSLLKERNRIRGLIGASKSRKIDLNLRDKKDKLIRTRQFQRSLSAALIQAREKISATQFDKFLSWLESQTTSLLSEYRSYATNSELTSEALHAHALPLHKEILWTVARLLQHAQLIRDFRVQAAELEGLVWTGSWDQIETLLDSIEKTFGKTIWVLEARITLEQDVRGLEFQKKIVKTERQIAARGLTTFISHYISVRNEPTTVLNRFISDLETRLEKEITEPLQDFLRYRILGVTKPGQRRLANVLQIAQGLAEVDLYETLIFVSQQLVADGTDAATSEALVSGLTKLSTVQDPRIDKILLLLGHHRENRFARRDIDATDAALAGSSFSVLKKATKALKVDPRDFKAGMLAAAELRGRLRPALENTRNQWRELIGLMGNVLTYSNTYESDLDALSKYLVNHSFLPYVRSFHDAFMADMRSTVRTERRLRRLAALNSPFLDPDELCLLPRSVVDSYISELRKVYDGSNTLEWNIQSLKQAIPDSRCRPFSADISIETDGGLTDSTALSNVPKSVTNRWRTVFSGLTALQAEVYQNNTPEVVRLISDLYLNKEFPLAVIPVAGAVGHLKWKQLRSSHRELSLSITLHLYWRATNSEEAATNVRFAYDSFLESQSITSATHLLERAHEFDRQQLIYFLQHVCVPSVMDMNCYIESSKGAEAERRRICSVLCDVDPGHRTSYEEEIVGLVHAESLEEGIRIVDSSRVHVDTNAIKAWAKREWEAQFGRYRALVDAGVGLAEKIDVVLREVAKTANAPSIYLQTPESEADQILIELMIAMRDKFLLDPQHGLDSYLSRRVRHHSMGGYLRGPLEEAKLITFKHATTKHYLENVYWLERIPNIIPREHERLNRSFEQFADEVDRLIATLKNDLFRVRGEDHPKGLFDIPVTSAAVHLARSAVQSDLSLDGFCNICFSLCWGSLDSSLQLARRQLRIDTKNALSGAFHRLRASLKKTLADPMRYAELSAAMGHASEHVLRETDKMADWFMRRELSASPLIYSLDKIFEIAIRSALESHRPFEPEVTISIDSDYELKASDLVVIAEIMLTTIGNAKQYSDGVHMPTLNVQAKCKFDEQLLWLRIENKVGPRYLQAAALQRIESIRKQIDDGSYVEKVRSEGESGLMKIASTISQSSRGRLDFGFTEAQLFFTDVTLSFIPN